MDRPDTVEGLLRSTGLRPERIWRERLHHQWDRSSFWELASGSGANWFRLSLLNPVTRAGVPARVQSGLGRLAPEDFLWEGEIICVVATKAATQK